MMQYSIKIIHNIISGIPDMTGIKTYAYFALVLCPVYYFTKLLESTANLRTFTRHCLQKNSGVHFRPHSFIQCIRDLNNTLFRSLSCVGAGMKIIQIPWQQLHPLQILLQHIQTVRSCFGLWRAKIHCIAAVRNKRPECFPLNVSAKLPDIVRINFSCFAAPGIFCKPCKSIPAKATHCLSHSLISVRHWQMASYIDHSFHIRSFFLEKTCIIKWSAYIQWFFTSW